MLCSWGEITDLKSLVVFNAHHVDSVGDGGWGWGGGGGGGRGWW